MEKEKTQNAAEGGNQSWFLVENELFNFYIGYKAGGKLKSSIERAKKSIF